MELRDYLGVLRRRWLSVVIVTLLTVALTTGVTLAMTPKYTATTRLFFGVQGGDTVYDLAQGSSFTQQQMSSYAEVVTSPLVLNRVIKELGLNLTAKQLAKTVTAEAPIDTVILEISATDTSAEQAARIANSIAGELTSVAGELVPERPDGSQPVRATILAPAIAPDTPSSPLVARNLALGLALGLLLGIGAALLRHGLDTKIRSEHDVKALTESAIIGVVPFDADAPTHPVIMHSDPLGPRAEAVRRLRVNLQFVDVAAQAKSIVISSSVPEEGKTTTAINLAVSLADAGLRVILVDADLRRPSIAQYLGLEGGAGLTTVLIGRASVTDVVQPWEQTSLDILPAGQVPPNPSELLGSAAMSSLLQQLSNDYDMVLLDSPPLLPVADAVVLSKAAGGTLLVVGVDKIHRPQLRDALESLTTVDATVLGLVLNKIARRDTSAYVYDTGYAPKAELAWEASSNSPSGAEPPGEIPSPRVQEREPI